jgi:cell division septation protein DedD
VAGPRCEWYRRGMRDHQRLREKIELTLDDRQVAALAVGALLLLAGVFALGLLVGKQLARSASQPAAIGDLAALDAQRADSRNAQRPPAGSPIAPAQGTTEALHERVPGSSKPAPAVGAAKAKEMPPPPAAVAMPPAQPVVVRPSQSAALPSPPAEPGKFTVQLGASQDRAEALQLASRATAAGLKPYVVEARLPGKGVWYRVRVGAFADRGAADRYRRDVERETRTSAAVMPSR